MERNNIENQIKDKLNSREIQPSAQAWDRLDAMLSIAEEKKTSPFSNWSFQFIGIAASILIFIAAGLFFFNQKDAETKPQNTIVIQELKKDSLNGRNKTPFQEKTEWVQKEKPISKKEQQPQSIINKQKQGVSIMSAVANTKINQKSIKNQEQKTQNQDVNAQKIMPNPSKEINIDELLATAQAKEKHPESKRKPSVKINVSSLLSEVDNELELTFREKVLNSINKNYQAAKVAIVNRNNQ